MANAADVQNGLAKIHGIAGAATITVGSVVLGIDGVGCTPAGQGVNVSDAGITDSFKWDESPSTDGVTIQSACAYQRTRELTLNLVPAGITKANALAAAISILTVLTPGVVVQTTGFTFTALVGYWNYIGGANIKLTRDGYVVADVRLKQYEDPANAGAFKQLAVVSA